MSSSQTEYRTQTPVFFLRHSLSNYVLTTTTKVDGCCLKLNSVPLVSMNELLFFLAPFSHSLKELETPHTVSILNNILCLKDTELQQTIQASNPHLRFHITIQNCHFFSPGDLIIIVHCFAIVPSPLGLLLILQTPYSVVCLYPY